MAVNMNLLTTALTSLNAGQLFNLSNQLTQANEVKALQILMMMSANPPGAPMLISSLTSIPGLPPQVLTFAEAAIAAVGTPSFAQDMTQAQAALQAAPVSALNLAL
jgi:hypothetical protein